MRHLPLMITCVEFENFVIDYLEGRLSARERRRFEIHLWFCRECREYLAAYQGAREMTRRAVVQGEPELPDVPEDLIKAVLAARSPG